MDLRHSVHSMTGAKDPLGPILERVGDARIVLLGEATHGTHEFYRTRALITRRLIEEKGFHAVVAEADWPDAYRVNRFVRGRSADRDASAALGDFQRFPTWMWRNTDVRAFVSWFRQHNDALDERDRVGFYGMDLYSMYASMDAVLHYLDRVDPDAAQRARARYSCFDHFRESPQSYGYAASLGITPDCQEEVITELMDLRRKAERYLARDGFLARDEQFFAEQNARLVKNAERYYHGMFAGRVNTWNLRDTHMVETIASLAEHLSGELGEPAKIAVWAHNSHLGDARATDRAEAGELNVGQLVRQQHGPRAVIVGFTTDHGTVAAADDWDQPVRHKRVRSSLPGSWERELHEVGLERFTVIMDEAGSLLRGRKLNRAIGVIYRPETERHSHYFHTEIAKQFDVVIHIDVTRAVHPLEPPVHWTGPDLPETFPSGL